MSEKAECTGDQLDYQSYLLRLWRVNDGEEGWRASLESAHTGERRGFADLKALFSFLRRQTVTGQSAHVGENEGGGSGKGEERR